MVTPFRYMMNVGDEVSSDIKNYLPNSPKEVREINEEAIWSLSSCKAGYGVDQLLDNNMDSYWQSDGPQPHVVNIQFRKKTTLAYLSVFVDFKADESYTPSRIAIKIGSHSQDLREFRKMEMTEPIGWQTVEMKEEGRYVRAFMVQIQVLQNHQNGRDTHVRQVKVFSPTCSPVESDGEAAVKKSKYTVDLNQFGVIR